MSKRWIVVGIVVLVLAAASVTGVMAQEPETNPAPDTGSGWFGRGDGGFGPMNDWGGNFGRMMRGWGNNFGPMFGRDDFGPMMRGRGGNFGPMFDEEGFGPMMRGRGSDFGPMFGRHGFGPMMHGRGGHFGPMFGRGMGAGNGLVAVAAEQLEMTVQELAAELQDGKTIAEIAEAQNVELSSIVDAFLAPRSERLDQAVENGRITREEADELLATLEANVTERLSQPWSGWQRGMGFNDEDGDGVCDFHGMHGRGQGEGFIDENGNGICDRMETADPAGEEE